MYNDKILATNKKDIVGQLAQKEIKKLFIIQKIIYVIIVVLSLISFFSIEKIYQTSSSRNAHIFLTTNVDSINQPPNNTYIEIDNIVKINQLLQKQEHQKNTQLIEAKNKNISSLEKKLDKDFNNFLISIKTICLLFVIIAVFVLLIKINKRIAMYEIKKVERDSFQDKLDITQTIGNLNSLTLPLPESSSFIGSLNHSINVALTHINNNAVQHNQKTLEQQSSRVENIEKKSNEVKNEDNIMPKPQESLDIEKLKADLNNEIEKLNLFIKTNNVENSGVVDIVQNRLPKIVQGIKENYVINNTKI